MFSLLPAERGSRTSGRLSRSCWPWASHIEFRIFQESCRGCECWSMVRLRQWHSTRMIGLEEEIPNFGRETSRIPKPGTTPRRNFFENHLWSRLRRGEVIKGKNVHKLVTNQASCLTFAGIHDHVGSWVHRICSRHSMTEGCWKAKCTVGVCTMHLPQHIKHCHVCCYGGGGLEKELVRARSNFVD